MNKNDIIVALIYTAIILLYIGVASCSPAKPTIGIDTRPVKAKWIYKVDAVTKDNDTTFQKIIK